MLKFGSKAPLKKQRNLSLSLRRKTVTVTMMTKGLGLTGAGIKVFEDIDSKEQQTELHKEL